MAQSKLPEDANTADLITWRYVGFILPVMPADGSPCLVDVLERTYSPNNQLVRSETEYNGDGTFYAMQGQAVYWCYRRPLPAEYMTEEEASADLDVCGYAGKWKSAKITYSSLLKDNELCPADYWLRVRLYYLELGGCYLSQRTPPLPADYVPTRTMPLIPVQPYHLPQKVRQG